MTDEKQDWGFYLVTCECTTVAGKSVQRQVIVPGIMPADAARRAERALVNPMSLTRMQAVVPFNVTRYGSPGTVCYFDDTPQDVLAFLFPDTVDPVIYEDIDPAKSKTSKRKWDR